MMPEQLKAYVWNGLPKEKKEKQSEWTWEEGEDAPKLWFKAAAYSVYK